VPTNSPRNQVNKRVPSVIAPSVPRLAARVIAPFPTGRKALPSRNIWCAFAETPTKWIAHLFGLNYI